MAECTLNVTCLGVPRMRIKNGNKERMVERVCSAMSSRMRVMISSEPSENT